MTRPLKEQKKMEKAEEVATVTLLLKKNEN
jgi:hypothetical protein